MHSGPRSYVFDAFAQPEWAGHVVYVTHKQMSSNVQNKARFICITETHFHLQQRSDSEEVQEHARRNNSAEHEVSFDICQQKMSSLIYGCEAIALFT